MFVDEGHVLYNKEKEDEIRKLFDINPKHTLKSLQYGIKNTSNNNKIALDNKNLNNKNISNKKLMCPSCK
jgi:hypothetical protein